MFPTAALQAEQWPSDSDDEDPPSRKRARSQPKVRGSSQRGGGVGPARRKQQQTLAGKPSACPHGYVKCPICSRDVPAFFINSHVDECLRKQAKGGSSSQAPPKQQQQQQQRRSGSIGAGPGPPPPPPPQQQATAAAPSERPFKPLAVPPPFVGYIATEKKVREHIKKYGLPTDGKKPVGVLRRARLPDELPP